MKPLLIISMLLFVIGCEETKVSSPNNGPSEIPEELKTTWGQKNWDDTYWQ